MARFDESWSETRWEKPRVRVKTRKRRWDRDEMMDEEARIASRQRRELAWEPDDDDDDWDDDEDDDWEDDDDDWD